MIRKKSTSSNTRQKQTHLRTTRSWYGAILGTGESLRLHQFLRISQIEKCVDNHCECPGSWRCPSTSRTSNGDAFEPDQSDHKNHFLIIDYQANRIVNELDVPDSAFLAVTINPDGRGIALVSGNLMGFYKSQKKSLLHTWSVDEGVSIVKGQAT